MGGFKPPLGLFKSSRTKNHGQRFQIPRDDILLRPAILSLFPALAAPAYRIWRIARSPDVIFPRVFRFIVGWIIPVVIVADMQARLLIEPLGHPGWLMFYLVLAESIAFCLSRIFWRFARRHYSSKLVKGLGPGARDCSFFAGKSLLAPPGKCP